MAYILEKIGNTYNLPKKYFTCDAKSDLDGISLVDVPIGSEAYCILEEETYILDSNKQWHKKKIGDDLTGQIQANLSQTDSTKSDYVKGVLRNNHLPEGYPYKGIGTILDGTFEFTDMDGIYEYQITDENFTIVYGKSYTVIWDGVTYQCVATTFNGILVLGNLAIAGAGADTGEPFLSMDLGNGQELIGTNSTAATHTISVCVETIHPIADEFIPSRVTAAIENAATKENPMFTGSFSQNRKENTVIGFRSHAEGYETTASGNDSHTEGFRTTASGNGSHAEGSNCTASGDQSHAECQSCKASGQASHAEGYYCTASGKTSHAEGYYCTAQGKNQRVQGKFNIASGTSDSIVDSDYSHIVGNGTSNSAPSNAHTLTWSGDPWYQGRPQFGGTAMDNGSQTVMANGDKEIILASSTAESTKKFKITVDDSGTIIATEVT